MIRSKFARNVALGSALAVGGAAIASAQMKLNVKLGLWEVTSTHNIAGMPIPNMPNVDLSKLPPEQRQRMEAMMKGGGSPGGGKPTVTKSCMTKEKMEKAFMEDRPDQKCKQTVINSTASVADIKVECTGAQTLNGTMHFEALTPEAVKGTMHFAGDAEGHQISIDSNIAAKWISADCGDVK